MAASDHTAGLPAVPGEVLQKEPTPLQIEPALFRESVWRSSWVERIVMLMVPLALFSLFVCTTKWDRSEYCWCRDEAFYHRVHSYEIHAMTRYYLFGYVVSEPAPLMTREMMKKYTFQKYGVAFGPQQAFGMSLYPETLIQQVGLLESEVMLCEMALTGLLGFWSLLGTTNLISFALYRRRVERYGAYPVA